MDALLTNQLFIIGVLSALIFGITQGLKQFIKLGTKRIKNERVRRMVNMTILLLPFGLAFLAEFLWGVLYLQGTYSVECALTYGTGAISLYGIVERFLKVKNPYDTAEGKEALELVGEITKDGKVDKNDISAVERFIKKV